MTDIIKLLPDSVANQIAAGEVIQRPASVLKELVENAIDAGASNIRVYLKDAGRTQIQVIDNGCGMSETDARLAFERHATSKIREAKDLFSLHTLGFRGEALPSIASVAEVQVRTRRANDEIGTCIDIAGSRINAQEPAPCEIGTVFTVRNLFFNIPVRRKFLKTDSVELKLLLNEFKRIALVYPDIALLLKNNDVEIYNLPASNLGQRIINVFGKNMKQSLLPVATETTLVKISGFVGRPESSKKTAGDQFFFANGRYIRHPYLHRAVMQAYEGLLPHEHLPTYFIYFEVPTDSIDINIHPTKTEVKFEDERAIFQFLASTVKQALGKFIAAPAIDFDNAPTLNIPALTPDTQVRMPKVNVNANYNPFDTPQLSPLQQSNKQNWEKLYEDFESGSRQAEIFATTAEADDDGALQPASFMQLKGRYILTSVKSGLMIIDQKRAHERILFEKYLRQVSIGKMSQQSLFPETVDLSPDDVALWQELNDDFAALGFDIRQSDTTLVAIHGHPAETGKHNAAQLFLKLLDDYRHDETDLAESRRERLAALLAQEAAIDYNAHLSNDEMSHLAEQLFVCETPNYSPTGKPVMHLIDMNSIEHFFVGR